MLIQLEQEGSLKIEIIGRDPDVILYVELSVPGFTATTETYVVEDAWHHFLEEMTALEDKQQGSAIVESMSPRELKLVFRSLDAAGHMGVEGYIGIRGGRNEFHFTFDSLPFDPTLVPSIVNELQQS